MLQEYTVPFKEVLDMFFTDTEASAVFLNPGILMCLTEIPRSRHITIQYAALET
jgi:hypothetical protein